MSQPPRQVGTASGNGRYPQKAMTTESGTCADGTVIAGNRSGAAGDGAGILGWDKDFWGHGRGCWNGAGAFGSGQWLPLCILCLEP